MKLEDLFETTGVPGLVLIVRMDGAMIRIEQQSSRMLPILEVPLKVSVKPLLIEPPLLLLKLLLRLRLRPLRSLRKLLALKRKRKSVLSGADGEVAENLLNMKETKAKSILSTLNTHHSIMVHGEDLTMVITLSSKVSLVSNS